ncbi:hypothetical protein BDA96_04G063500 [Sorghum bicolor]|uniref:Uncharacterized protein n=1 Tax=Sorghum bicolor TaxID=4558 RepID=A0A921R234_SORBI|nr:hypothetical protein BDA96_04G063500 [Sorghum bicolor]
MLLSGPEEFAAHPSHDIVAERCDRVPFTSSSTTRPLDVRAPGTSPKQQQMEARRA